jgi:amino acid transporter
MPLKRALGVSALTFYGVGIILGAGIYSVLGAAAGHAGDALWQSFLVSSIVALLTALSYAELATTYPRASAEFTYLRHALPGWPRLALVTGLLVALSGAATAATVSIAFASYVQTFVQGPGLIIAWALLLASTAINLLGVQASGWVNAAFTLLEAGGLVLFVGLGVSAGEFENALSAAPHWGVVSGAALVFFSFLGFENIANLSEEAKNPERDLARAIFLSLAIATTLYVLVALAAVSLVPAQQLASTGAPLADAARAASRRIAGALSGIALFATANTALVSILVASRVLYGMARDGALPKRLSVTGRTQTPWLAVLLVAGASAALVPFGKVGVVASMSSFAALLSFALVNVALIVLRYRDPDTKRPFRVPGAIGRFAVLPAFGALTTVFVATQLDKTALLGGSGILIVFSLYALTRKNVDAQRL